MSNYRLFVSTGLNFADSTEALQHIGERMVKEGVVCDTYPQLCWSEKPLILQGSPLKSMLLPFRIVKQFMQENLPSI